MVPEGSLPHSQVPATCPYPEPARSSPYPHIPLPAEPSKYSEPALCRLLTFQVPDLMSLSLLMSCESINPDPRQTFVFRNKTSFYAQELSTTLPSLKLEDNPLSAVRDCLFSIFLHNIALNVLHIHTFLKMCNFTPRRQHVCTVGCRTCFSWLITCLLLIFRKLPVGTSRFVTSLVV